MLDLLSLLSCVKNISIITLLDTAESDRMKRQWKVIAGILTEGENERAKSIMYEKDAASNNINGKAKNSTLILFKFSFLESITILLRQLFAVYISATFVIYCPEDGVKTLAFRRNL